MRLFGRFGKVRKIKQNVRWFFQRGKKGFCDKDLWELPTWFSTTFSAMLKEFSEKTLDYPLGFPGAYSRGALAPHAVVDPSEDAPEQYLAWKEMVFRVGELFECIDTDCGWVPSDDARRKLDEALELLRKYYFDLWC